jgi:hypothetical protein
MYGVRIYKELKATQSPGTSQQVHASTNPSNFIMTLKTMQAIKIVSAGKAEVQTVPVPALRDHYILVKVNAVAINPVRASR